GNEPREGEAAGAATPQEVEDRQLDVALESRELEKVLARLPKATDLAKERLAEASQLAEGAAEAIGRGAIDEAQSAVTAAETKFEELAEQVRALVAEEQAERIAIAQQLASQLARQQQEFSGLLGISNAGTSQSKSKTGNGSA